MTFKNIKKSHGTPTASWQRLCAIDRVKLKVTGTELLGPDNIFRFSKSRTAGRHAESITGDDSLNEYCV